MKGILITISLLFTLSVNANTKALHIEDKKTSHKLVKKSLKQLFLLETTKYNSKKLKKNLLRTLPKNIFWEIEYITKHQLLKHNIWLAKGRRNTLIKSQRTIKDIECHYIEDGSIDCNVKEDSVLFHTQSDSPKLFESSGGADYKFNLTMNDRGKWKINKMKAYTVSPLPKLSTLEIDAQEEQERLNPKMSFREDIPEEERPHMAKPRSIKGMGEARRQTALLSEEEQALKEEQESILQEIREYNKKHKQTEPRIDQNGNKLTPPTSTSTNNKTFQPSLSSKSTKSRPHPIYGYYWGYQRGKLWIPYYAVK